MTRERVNANVLVHEMRRTRQAFGYEYKRKDYASSPRVREMWARSAPWATGSMVVMASNLREALMRDLAFRMPVHDPPFHRHTETS